MDQHVKEKGNDDFRCWISPNAPMGLIIVANSPLFLLWIFVIRALVDIGKNIEHLMEVQANGGPQQARLQTRRLWAFALVFLCSTPFGILSRVIGYLAGAENMVIEGMHVFFSLFTVRVKEKVGGKENDERQQGTLLFVIFNTGPGMSAWYRRSWQHVKASCGECCPCMHNPMYLEIEGGEMMDDPPLAEVPTLRRERRKRMFMHWVWGREKSAGRERGAPHRPEYGAFLRPPSDDVFAGYGGGWTSGDAERGAAARFEAAQRLRKQQEEYHGSPWEPSRRTPARRERKGKGSGVDDPRMEEGRRKKKKKKKRVLYRIRDDVEKPGMLPPRAPPMPEKKKSTRGRPRKESLWKQAKSRLVGARSSDSDSQERSRSASPARRWTRARRGSDPVEGKTLLPTMEEAQGSVSDR